MVADAPLPTLRRAGGTLANKSSTMYSVLTITYLYKYVSYPRLYIWIAIYYSTVHNNVLY